MSQTNGDPERSAMPRVLVAEDEEDVRTLIVRILGSKMKEARCDLAKDGVEALERLDAGDYSAIILDLMMPRLDGFGVIRELSKRNPDALSRVIVVTAASSDVIEKIDPRVFAILRKPFPLVELLVGVRSCLESAAVVTSRAASAP